MVASNREEKGGKHAGGRITIGTGMPGVDTDAVSVACCEMERQEQSPSKEHD